MPTHTHSPSRTSQRRDPRIRAALPVPGLRPQVAASDVADELYANDIVGARFLLRMEQLGLTHVASRAFPRDESASPDIGGFGVVELSWATGKGYDTLISPHDEPALALLIGRRGTCEVVVAAQDADAADAVAQRLDDALRDPPPPDDRVNLRFWASGHHGAEVERRAVDAPEWRDVAGNYPSRARAQVDRLVAATEPVGGSVVLWHGPPGTGKTHALQALTRAWRPWCTTHYVTDPERLLSGTGYLMEVATRGLGADSRDWRLIVLEDAGELMAADARSEIGQGLSRVLNLTDGLLGQGLRCLLLVTTNEPLGRLHPAIRRPGRCWAEIEFPAFDVQEAAAWLALNEIEAEEPRRPLTLAELYALAEDRELEGSVAAAQGFGFARGG